MGENVFKYLLAILTFTSAVTAQVNDSLDTSLESLLEGNIEAIQYVESASKYSQPLEKLLHQ
ncbi:MAG: hypothetical protein GY936_17125 [Ignavibacteriae bacterium]|nr:hypothetical protein [Ignavibacteriota bacterium]